MTAVARFIVLRCDAVDRYNPNGCPVTFETQAFNTRNARQEASEQGWSYRRAGGDLCDGHTRDNEGTDRG